MLWSAESSSVSLRMRRAPSGFSICRIVSGAKPLSSTWMGAAGSQVRPQSTMDACEQGGRARRAPEMRGNPCPDLPAPGSGETQVCRATSGREEGRAGVWGCHGAGKGAEPGLGFVWGRGGWRMLQRPLQREVTGGGLTSSGSSSFQLPPWRRRRRRRKEAASAAVTERFREHRIAPGQHAEACGREGHVRSGHSHHGRDGGSTWVHPRG